MQRIASRRTALAVTACDSTFRRGSRVLLMLSLPLSSRTVQRIRMVGSTSMPLQNSTICGNQSSV